MGPFSFFEKMLEPVGPNSETMNKMTQPLKSETLWISVSTSQSQRLLNPTFTRNSLFLSFFLGDCVCVVLGIRIPWLTDTEMIFPLRLFCAVAIAGFIFVDGGGVIIPSTLDGPFEPVTVPFDESLRGNAVDLPDSDPRVKRRVKGFEPEQISISLSAHYDSVWISWITGISISFSHFDSFSSKRISSNSLLTLPLLFLALAIFLSYFTAKINIINLHFCP